MKVEFREIALDTLEHVRYFRELGVDSFDVELPVETVAARSEPAPAAVSVPADREILERFVPPENIVRPIAPAAKPENRPRGVRLGLLESTKLSNLRPSAPVSVPSAPVQKIEMPKKTDSPSDDIFGDVSSSLPITNESIESIRAEIGDCRRCELCAGRTNIAHSQGSFSADLMFIGEAPGADEDAQGAPFVGRAGQLLTKIIEAIGMKREDVFIGNINRCRPPGNRAPLPDETASCKPFLLREIAVVRPKVIVVLGNTAMKNLLDTKEGITKLRGIFQDFYGVKVMPTFHPAYLLRDPSKKREVWDDMKKVRDYLNQNQ